MLEYSLNLAGCDCAVVEWNPQGSILVFALHGWLDNLATFESLASYMPNVRVIAVDFPGHGHSAHISPNSTYHFIDGLYLIDDLLQHFQQKSINLLGHSMGGAISTLFAAAQPNRVTRLILIESLGPLTAEPTDGLELLQKAINQRASLKNKSKPVYSSFALALLARATAGQIEPTLIEPIVERGLTHQTKGYTWRADSRLRTTSPIRMSEAHLRAILANIGCNVLLLEGEKGYLADERYQQRKNHLQRLQVETLSGGHHVHLQQPQVCAHLIQAFLQQTD